MNEKYKDMLVKAGRTFLQAFLAYLSLNLVDVVANGLEDFELLKTAMFGLLMSAIAAGIAAVMNLPKFGTDDEGGETVADDVDELDEELEQAFDEVNDEGENL